MTPKTLPRGFRKARRQRKGGHARSRERYERRTRRVGKKTQVGGGKTKSQKKGRALGSTKKFRQYWGHDQTTKMSHFPEGGGGGGVGGGEPERHDVKREKRVNRLQQKNKNQSGKEKKKRPPHWGGQI